MKKLTVCAALFFFFGLVKATDKRVESMIPQPQKIETLSSVRVRPLTMDSRVNARLKLPSDEAYTIKITKDKIVVRAKSNQGLIWANRTLEQLKAPNGYYPSVYIEDYPAFPIRGFMHDTGRNFLPVGLIKKHIDVLSKYKINVFQWHLTDNPAWRIECKVYPELNDPHFQRKGRDEGSFYTYDEIRDVIEYAAQRGVQVVPEIDMPGHSRFFNDTFGFSMDSPQGRAVLEKCLDEFFTEIPATLCPYFHIGSDEVHIKDPKGFMQWAENLVARYNRTPIAWDPGLPSSATTIRQIWNEAEGENTVAAQKPGKFLDSFMGYLNFYDPVLFTNKMFLHNPCGTGFADERATGGVLCLWNDVRSDDKNKLELHNGMINGLLPFAERFWKGGSVGHTDHSCLTPAPDTKPGIALQEFEERLAFHRDSLLTDCNVRWVGSAPMQWEITLPARRGAGKDTLSKVKAWGGVIEMDALCKKHKVKMSPVMDAWATTRIEAQSDTTIYAWIGYEATARSNRISNGIGYQGLWENDGRFFVEGVEIFPSAQWKEPAKYRYHYHTWHKPEEEQPFTDEQFYWMRQPVSVPLKKGVNTIEMYIPRVFAGQRWTFAFIPLTVDGEKVSEVSGIRFLQSEDK